MKNRRVLSAYFPPPGRPGWSASRESPLDLFYLGWGWRKYGVTPMPPMLIKGWVYSTVRRGFPVMQTPDRPCKETRYAEDDFFIIHPDCFCGWNDSPKNTTQIYTWVWRTPSRWKILHPPAEGFLKLKVPAPIRRKIYRLHDQMRREIQNPDENTTLAIESFRLQIDLLLARSSTAQPHPALASQRLDLARQWIEHHLNEHNATAGLCDYLQLSDSTLNRLFQKFLNTNVRSYAKERRLQRARELLNKERKSVKEIAYLLGYRFPNDLSRALNDGKK